MKKVFIILSAVALVASMSSCKKDCVEKPKEQEPPRPVYVHCLDSVNKMWPHFGVVPIWTPVTVNWGIPVTYKVLNNKPGTIGVDPSGNPTLDLYSIKASFVVRKPGSTHLDTIRNVNVACGTGTNRVWSGLGFHDEMYQNKVVGINWRIQVNAMCWSVPAAYAVGDWNYACNALDSTLPTSRNAKMSEPTIELTYGSPTGKAETRKMTLSQYRAMRGLTAARETGVNGIQSLSKVELWYNGKAVMMNVNIATVPDFICTYALGLNLTTTPTTGADWDLVKIIIEPNEI